MKKRIKLCLTMALRDYSSFEDLATELGVGIEEVTILNDENDNQRAPIIHRVRLTPEIRKAVLEYPLGMAHTAVRSQMIKKWGMESTPSANSIAKIRLQSKLEGEPHRNIAEKKNSDEHT